MLIYSYLSDCNFIMLLMKFIGLVVMLIHHVPKLVASFALETPNLFCSSWISMKYHTLHYLNITKHHTYYIWRLHLTVCVLSVVSLWHLSFFKLGLCCDEQSNQEVVHQFKNLRQGEMWPLRAQTLKTGSEW